MVSHLIQMVSVVDLTTMDMSVMVAEGAGGAQMCLLRRRVRRRAVIRRNLHNLMIGG